MVDRRQAPQPRRRRTAASAFPQEGMQLIGGLRTHWLHWPGTGPGPTFVLLHGLASNARIWELTAPRLVASGGSAWAIDLRGHGLSGKPSTGYNYPTVVADVEAFLRWAGIRRPILVGHSWGASVALEFAARHANRGYARPAGLALVDGAMVQMADIPNVTWEEMRRRLAPPRLAGTSVVDLRRRLEAPNRRWVPQAQAQDIILANFAINQNGVLHPHLTYERHIRILKTIWAYRAYERYLHVGCPASLIVAVPKAPRTPHEEAFLRQKRQGARIARQRLSQVEISWMRDTVHDIPLQRPLALSRILRRLADGQPG